MTPGFRSSLGILCLALAASRLEAGASGTVEKAREAVESGNVVPERDLAPLVQALMKTSSNGAADTLIRGIVKLGDADGGSPAAVKEYLRKEAPAALLRVARGNFGWSERGDALMALRSLEADEAAMREGIEIARADRTKERDYIHGRGRMLEDWLGSRRRSGVTIAALPRPKDPAAEQRVLRLLRERSIGVSAYSMQEAAMNARPEVVQALLDAGVSAQVGDFMSPLAAATFLGCAPGVEGSVENRLKVMEILVQAGADPKAADDLGNTLLLQTAHLCPLPVVKKLVELGAPVNSAPNAQHVTPLGMTFTAGKWDVAEYLVDSGARITPKEVEMVFFEKPTDPRQVALLKRAQQGAAK